MYLEKAGFHILDCCSGKDEPNPAKGCRELKKPNSNNEDTASSILEESNRLVHNYIIFLTISYTLSIIKRTQHTQAKFCNSFISVSISTQLCIPRRNGKYSMKQKSKNNLQRPNPPCTATRKENKISQDVNNPQMQRNLRVYLAFMSALFI